MGQAILLNYVCLVKVLSAPMNVTQGKLSTLALVTYIFIQNAVVCSIISSHANLFSLAY